jgi:hypothetical protein
LVIAAQSAAVKMSVVMVASSLPTLQFSPFSK